MSRSRAAGRSIPAPGNIVKKKIRNSKYFSQRIFITSAHFSVEVHTINFILKEARNFGTPHFSQIDSSKVEKFLAFAATLSPSCQRVWESWAAFFMSTPRDLAIQRGVYHENCGTRPKTFSESDKFSTLTKPVMRLLILSVGTRWPNRNIARFLVFYVAVFDFGQLFRHECLIFGSSRPQKWAFQQILRRI